MSLDHLVILCFCPVGVALQRCFSECFLAEIFVFFAQTDLSSIPVPDTTDVMAY